MKITLFFSGEKLNAIYTLLEAFGNCRTVMNANATRFTQLFSIDLDHSGQIASASLQVMKFKMFSFMLFFIQFCH